MSNEKEYKVLKVIKKGKKYLVYFDNYEDEVILNEEFKMLYTLILNLKK